MIWSKLINKTPLRRFCQLLWLLFFVLACKNSSSDQAQRSDSLSDKQKSSTHSTDQQPSSALESGKRSKVGSSDMADFLHWIDPQANDLWIGRISGIFDQESFSTMIALPPRAAKAMREVADFETAMDIYLGDSETSSSTEPKPNSKNLLHPAFAVFRPAVASGNYILRKIKAPPHTFAQSLLSSGWTERKYDGTSQYSRNANFPWKIAVLDDQTVVGIPLTEIGSGLGPLNIARELPFTGMRQQIDQQFATNSSMVALLFSSGPMLHWSLDDNVEFVRLAVQRWKSKGYDIKIEMGYVGEGAAALNALRNRELSGESNQFKLLANRVAFEINAGQIAGRIQITGEDLVHLKPRDGLL